MTDEQKLKITREAFENKLITIETWSDFKTMLSGLTKAKVKNFIKANLEEEKQGHLNASASATIMANNVDALITEVDNI